MKQIAINPNNRKYYSEDFTKGFKCGAQRQFEADKADRPQGEVDAIDRDALIDYCLKLIDVERKQGSDVMNYGQERVNQTEAIIDYIEHMPHVNADRPQGEWIRDRYWSRGAGMGEEYGFFYKCSLCEYEVEDGYTRCGFNFCPYCGADMRKGADDE